jgi:hypothetical protein
LENMFYLKKTIVYLVCVMEYQCILTDSVFSQRLFLHFMFVLYSTLYTDEHLEKRKFVYEISGYQIVLFKWSLIKK